MNKYASKTCVAAVLGITFFSAAGAIADMGPKEYQLVYGKQELTTHQGVASLYERILRTAKDYCPGYSKVRSVRRLQTCWADVADDLVAKVNHPQLTSYHSSDGELRIAAIDQVEADNS